MELEFVDMPEEIRFAEASGMTFVVTVADERFGEKRAIVTGCSSYDDAFDANVPQRVIRWEQSK